MTMDLSRLLVFAFASLCLIGSPVLAESRTWTDGASKRSLEGEYVMRSGEKVVIRLASGETVEVALSRLSESDRIFVRDQAPGPGDALASIPCPISIEPLPVTGSGEDRKAALKVTNNGDQEISKLGLTMYLYQADGSLKQTVPYTNTKQFDGVDSTLGKGENYVVELTSFWVKDDVVAVGGLVRALTLKDGTTWPVWTGPAPDPEGEAPVSLVMKGVVREGALSAPLIEAFNHSDQGVKRLEYLISYVDESGGVLLKGRRTFVNADMAAGKGAAFFGSAAPPEGTASVVLALRSVAFDDDSKWKP
ncbi:hypothetical protein HZ994_03795 [Akkermansiaceae bacterium]|nr:hypothetical protein HZ994_03795 [Akkermansiaceae bacterium]